MAEHCKGLAGWLFGHKEVVTSQGYPAFARWWVVNSTCKRCGQRFRTTDDLFAPERPSHFDIDQDFMVRENHGISKIT
jgi:hypothetical protein